MVGDPTSLLLLVARTLDALRVRYVVGGSLASSQHGELRATNDIDLMVDLQPDRVPEFVRALKPDFDIWEDTVRAAVDAGRSFGALHIDWHVKVDFFPMGSSGLDAPMMERRQSVGLGPAPAQQVYFASPEDIILRKLRWYEKSGGVLERQLRDVAGVMKVQRTALDLDYLRTLARQEHLVDLLDRCLDEAGLS